MGLISNFLIGIIHLVFVAMDILVIMIVIKVVYQRWQLEILRPVARTVEPIIKSTTNWLNKCAMKITGKAYPERILLVFFILCLWLIRVLIVSILK